MENELRILTSPMQEPGIFPTMTSIKLRWWHRLFLAVAPTVTYHTKENATLHTWKYKLTPFGKVLISVSTSTGGQSDFLIDKISMPEDPNA